MSSFIFFLCFLSAYLSCFQPPLLLPTPRPSTKHQTAVTQGRWGGGGLLGTRAIFRIEEDPGYVRTYLYSAAGMLVSAEEEEW